MLLLDSVLKSIEVVLTTAPGVELPWTASYVDVTTTAFSPLAADGTTSGVTPVTLVTAPSASTQRQVKYLSIFNADSSSRTVKVQLDDNSTKRIIVTVTLNPGEHLAYTDGHGFQALAADGSVKGTVVVSGGIGATAKSGSLIPGAFSGSPLTASVVFATAYPDTSYTVGFDVLTNGAAAAYVIEAVNKATTGFDVHLGSSVIAGVVEVMWQAMPIGE